MIISPWRFPLASVERFCDAGALVMIISGAAAFLALSPLGGLTAQYGRHASPSTTTSRRRRRGGFLLSAFPSSLPARWAWLTQELPALLIAPLAFALALRALHEDEAGTGKSQWRRWLSSPPPLPPPPASSDGRNASLFRLFSAAPLPNRLLLLAFALHYTWRSLFYPLLIRGGKETRALEWALALAFCCWNGALQGAGAALVGRRRRRRRGSSGSGGRRRGGAAAATSTRPARSGVGLVVAAVAFLSKRAARGGPGRSAGRESLPFCSSSPFYLALFGVSLCLWALFWGLNLAADAHLRSLRRKKKTRKATTAAAAATAAATAGKGGDIKKEGGLEEEDRGYRLPTSPLFSLVACPNYGAECAEWACFAAASFFASRAAAAASPAGAGAAAAAAEGGRSGGVADEALPSLAFALFTAANLVPRALAHRRWYVEKFEDFPRGRRAIFPWVL